MYVCYPVTLAEEVRLSREIGITDAMEQPLHQFKKGRKLSPPSFKTNQLKLNYD